MNFETHLSTVSLGITTKSWWLYGIKLFL